MKQHESGRRRPLVRLESNAPLRDGDRDRELDGECGRGLDGGPAVGRSRELNDALNALFAASWPAHRPTDFPARLRRSLLWVAAYRDDGPDDSPAGGRDAGGPDAGQLDGAGAGSDAGGCRERGRRTARHVGGHGELVGFVNVVGDGGVHAFVLDTTVHPSVRGQGVGVRLVTQAADEAGRAGAEWLHVDYEEHLSGFYARCGFRPTAAGLRRLG